ncbi:MAG: FAD-binding protein [Eubacterium sp.]|nr:FAD-binding protein [Eubacterium sp.]
MKNEIKETRLTTDVLVIGGGIAGMFCAIKARQQGADVILLDKNYVGRSGGTHYAEGDIQFFRPKTRGHVLKDWVDKLSKDNEYLNDRKWHETILEESEDRYNDLLEWGIKFYEVNGELMVDGPHRFNPIPRMYEIISMRNREYAPSLRAKCLQDGIRVYDRIMTCELLKQDGRVVGAMGFHTTTGRLYTIIAKATVMCTGPGTAYKVRAMNTDYWTGDGILMAYRAGAEISGMEFRQSTGGTMKTVYEARKITYPGGGLDGQKLLEMTAEYPYCTIQSGWFWPQLTHTNEPVKWWGAGEIHEGKGPVYCDFDNMAEKLREHHEEYFVRVGDAEPAKIGFDVFNGGKAHYPSARQELNTPIGGSGIWPVDEFCTSTLPGLFAAGGGCATRVSGAKYGGMGLGLNAGMVTGTHAAKGVIEYLKNAPDIVPDEGMIEKVREVVTAPAARDSGHDPAWLTQILQHTLVPYYVSIYKHQDRMALVLPMIQYMKDSIAPNLWAKDPHGWKLCYETKNMIENAELYLKASMFRTESRGSHFREDYPERNDKDWLCWVKMRLEAGKDIYTKVPVPDSYKPDYSKPIDEIYPMTLPDVVEVHAPKLYEQ